MASRGLPVAAEYDAEVGPDVGQSGMSLQGLAEVGVRQRQVIPDQGVGPQVVVILGQRLLVGHPAGLFQRHSACGG